VDADLLGFSVRDLIDLADEVLSGALGPGPFDFDGDGLADVTVSDVSDALDVFNQNFDNGTQNNGNLGLCVIPRGQLLFRSGFEDDVWMNVPYVSGGQWWQDLRGEDEGFEWPFDLPDAQLGVFQYLVASNETIGDWIETSLEDVSGHDGSSTKALFMKVKGDSPGIFHLTRNQYNLYSYNGTLERGYARYWLKLQPDLETLMPSDAWYWRLVTELHENASNGDVLRVHLFVKRAPGYPLFWELESTLQTPSGIDSLWAVQNVAVPVPLGDWFLFELFWNRSTGADGRVWMSVNGEMLFDRHGPNKIDSPMSFWDCFKVYTGTASLALGEAYQWIDDFEIYADY
jgi:hypothetical protein